jgi:hypothetical protein
MTRADFVSVLEDYRGELEPGLRRLRRDGLLSEADRRAIAAAVADELEGRFVGIEVDDEKDVEAADVEPRAASSGARTLGDFNGERKAAKSVKGKRKPSGRLEGGDVVHWSERKLFGRRDAR